MGHMKTENRLKTGELKHRILERIEFSLDSFQHLAELCMCTMTNEQLQDVLKILEINLKEPPKYLTPDELEHGFPGFQKGIDRRERTEHK